MKWIRIWTKETFSGTTFQELNAEQRGIWFSLLVMAGLDIQPQQGEVALREGIGYDTQTLAKLLDCKPKILKKTLEILQKFEKIELKNSKNLKNGAIIVIKNWSKYQTEYAHYRREKPKNLDNSLDNSLDTHPRQIKNKIQNKNIPPLPPLKRGNGEFIASKKQAKPEKQKTETAIQQLVNFYKTEIEEIPLEDKSWDKKFYPKYVKFAKEILDFCQGNEKQSERVIYEIAEYLEGKKLDYNLATIARWRWRWKKGFKEEGE